jgi:hypothetical protein
MMDKVQMMSYNSMQGDENIFARRINVNKIVHNVT